MGRDPEDARPVAAYSEELRGMSRGGGLAMDPAAFVAIGALVVASVAIPLVVVTRGSRRTRRRS